MHLPYRLPKNPLWTLGRASVPRESSDQYDTGIFSTSLGTVWSHLVYEVGHRTKRQGGFSKPYHEMGRRGAHLPILCDSHEEHSGKAALQNQRTAVNLPAGASYGPDAKSGLWTICVAHEIRTWFSLFCFCFWKVREIPLRIWCPV